MKIMKRRKRIQIVAIATAVLGILGICNMAVVYLRFGHLFAQTVEQHPEMQWFVIAFKIMAFLVCPSLCILLVYLSLSILHYFKSEMTDK